MNVSYGFNEVTPRLDLLHFPARGYEVVSTECPNCTSYLTLIQPDLALPNRLIGACEQCKHWYLIDTVPDVSEGTMLRLPDVRTIRKLSQGNQSGGLSIDGERDSTGELEGENNQN